MLLALAICEKDLSQAERLVNWLGFLSDEEDQRLERERLLLLAACPIIELPAYARLLEIITNVFGEFIPVRVAERGVGWPGGPNDMMRVFLASIQHHGEPGLFLEPDAIPTFSGWFDSIYEEYEIHDMPFMGAWVPEPMPHMSGIGVYPPDWRRYAPSLMVTPDSLGWDTFCPEEVNPNCYFTPMIQHIFRRHEQGWSVPGLNALDKRAAIFHQDKTGKLIRMLDEARYGGRCRTHPLFGYDSIEPNAKTMTKFFSTVNATRAVTTKTGKRFVFDPCQAFGGSIPGVLATENVVDQDLLSDLAQNPTSGIEEITQQDWEKLTKKNWVHPVLTTLTRSNETLLPRAPIKPTPSRKAAEVVVEPLSHAGDPSAPPGLGAVKDINEVIKTDVIQPAQPQTPVRAKTKKPAPNQK